MMADGPRTPAQTKRARHHEKKHAALKGAAEKAAADAQGAEDELAAADLEALHATLYKTHPAHVQKV